MCVHFTLWMLLVILYVHPFVHNNSTFMTWNYSMWLILEARFQYQIFNWNIEFEIHALRQYAPRTINIVSMFKLICFHRERNNENKEREEVNSKSTMMSGDSHKSEWYHRWDGLTIANFIPMSNGKSFRFKALSFAVRFWKRAIWKWNKMMVFVFEWGKSGKLLKTRAN